MKKETMKHISVFCALISLFLVAPLINSQSLKTDCELNVTLLNQDPFPAMPGDSVEIVFQMSGVENSNCGGAYFEVIPKFPFSLLEGQERIRALAGSTWLKDYKKTWMIPYKFKVDEDAIEGWNDITTKFRKGSNGNNDDITTNKDFQIKVEDLRADFEVSVKDYDEANKEITFEILNIGKNDVEALTIEMPEQEHVTHYGSSRDIVGALDKNEETTFSFEAEAEQGSIDLTIYYTDSIDKRRRLEKKVEFNPTDFKTPEQAQSYPWYVYVIGIIVLYLVIKWVWNKFKKKKRKYH